MRSNCWASAPGFKPHFHIVAVIVERLDQLAALQLRIALVLHLHVVLAVAGLDLLQIAFQDGAAMIDQADRVAQPLDLVHAMGGEQDGLARLLQLDQDVLQHDRVGGIEAGEWLIHDDEIGIVQQRGDELHLLLHALGKLFHFLVRPVGDLQPLAPVPASACALRASERLCRRPRKTR